MDQDEFEYDLLSPGGTPAGSRRCSETGSNILPPSASISPQRQRSRSNSRTSRRVSLIPGEALEQAHAALAFAKQQEEKSNFLKSPCTSPPSFRHPPSHPNSLPQLLDHANTFANEGRRSSYDRRMYDHEQHQRRESRIEDKKKGVVEDDKTSEDVEGTSATRDGSGTGAIVTSPQR